MTKLFHIIMLVFIFGNELAAQKKYTEEVAAIQFLLDSIRPKSRVLQDKIFCYDGEVWEDSYWWCVSPVIPDYREVWEIGREKLKMWNIKQQKEKKDQHTNFAMSFRNNKKLRVCKWEDVKKMTEAKFERQLEKDSTYIFLSTVSSIKYDSTVNSETLVCIEVFGVNSERTVKQYKSERIGLYGIVARNRDIIFWRKLE